MFTMLQFSVCVDSACMVCGKKLGMYIAICLPIRFWFIISVFKNNMEIYWFQNHLYHRGL